MTVAGREGAATMQDGEQLAFSEASNRSNRVTNSSDITLLLFFLSHHEVNMDLCIILRCV